MVTEIRCQRCRDSCYGDVVTAYGKYYHQYCFSCTVPGCKQDLAQVGFFLIEDEIYCRDDYRKLMGVECAGCHKYVEGEAIAAIDSRFHPTCFGCVSCGMVFPVGSEICYDGEEFTCQTCHDGGVVSPREPEPTPVEPKPSPPPVAPKTVATKQPKVVAREPEIVAEESVMAAEEPEVPADEPVVPADEPVVPVIPKDEPKPPPSPPPEVVTPEPPPPKTSKPVATVTPNIGSKLNQLENSFDTPIIDEKKINALAEIRAPYENESKKNLSVCAGCDNVIKDGQALLALDKQWHLWCFACHKCGALLTAEYMGRDGIPYCERDYQEQFGITCAGCERYITGKVLQAGEKHYHPSCSRCAKCGEMFGEGEDMYLQGNEIWHPACSDEQDEEDEEDEEDGMSDGSTVSDLSEPDDDFPKENGVRGADIHPLPRSPSPPAHVPQTTVDFKSGVWKPNAASDPVPFGQKAVQGFRSVKPPGVHPKVEPARPDVGQNDAEDAPPVPPPPSRSSSSQWRSKYARPNSTTENKNIISVQQQQQQQQRPKSTIERRRRSEESDGSDGSEGGVGGGGGGSDGEGKQHLLTVHQAYSTNSLNSNASSRSNGSFRKGVGFNQLQHRMHSNSQKDVRNKLPTNIDPDRLRTFLQDPDHNVYLEDHEFVQIFKMTREKFYQLPNSKKKELKDGILFT